MPASLLNTILSALDAEAKAYELETGQGRSGNKDKYDERVGYSKGMRHAIEVVKNAAKSIDTEEG